jgi:hypothetical protein
MNLLPKLAAGCLRLKEALLLTVGRAEQLFASVLPNKSSFVTA